jgi:hypothetical protein
MGKHVSAQLDWGEEGTGEGGVSVTRARALGLLARQTSIRISSHQRPFLALCCHSFGPSALAVLALRAFFFFCFRSVFDGTIKHDIPIKEMSKLWGCNYFIVSQVNPVSGGKCKRRSASAHGRRAARD